MMMLMVGSAMMPVRGLFAQHTHRAPPHTLLLRAYPLAPVYSVAQAMRHIKLSLVPPCRVSKFKHRSTALHVRLPCERCCMHTFLGVGASSAQPPSFVKLVPAHMPDKAWLTIRRG